MNKISVVILTKNSAKYLRECLSSLTDFIEIILLDNGSTDDSITIAKSFKNVKVYENEFIGFGALKNLAISKTTNNWVLSVDSDEIFTQDLVNEILNLKLENNTIYSIKRDNYYSQKLIKCCGWNNDFVLRLFNKNSTKFNNNQVHESLIADNLEIEKLKNTFKHYSFDSASQLLVKMNHYSTLWVNDNQHKKTNFAMILLKTNFAFIKFYIFKGGFLYGYRGFLIAFSNAIGVFYKYTKLYELQKNLK